MNEEAFYEEILGMAAEKGYATAYFALRQAIEMEKCRMTPQCCYYLACLAGGSGKDKEALEWLEFAIETKGWWYRPEVLEDDDLAALFDDTRFVRLMTKSTEQWKAASEIACAEESWQKKTARNLLLAVHGNTQNAEETKKNWMGVTENLPDWQVETVLSHTVDGVGTRRWAYDRENYKDVAQAAAHMAAQGYDHTAWGGFSAGCDMLLRTVAFTPLRCDALLLQSPWLPLLEKEQARVCKELRDKKIRLVLSCGTEDEDCLPVAQALYAAAIEQGVTASLDLQEGMRHSFPCGQGAQALRDALRNRT